MKILGRLIAVNLFFLLIVMSAVKISEIIAVIEDFSSHIEIHLANANQNTV